MRVSICATCACKLHSQIYQLMRQIRSFICVRPLFIYSLTAYTAVYIKVGCTRNDTRVLKSHLSAGWKKSHHYITIIYWWRGVGLMVLFTFPLIIIPGCAFECLHIQIKLIRNPSARLFVYLIWNCIRARVCCGV